jgi:phospholipid transport system substrate-binding protein
VLQALAEDALTVLTDDGLGEKERQRAFRDLLQRGFDIDAVSRFVLGRYWRRASAEEREDFRLLFEDYVVATYAVHLSHYASDMFHIVGERRDEDARFAMVRSEIRPPVGPVLAVDWRMQDIDGEWRITDIVVEGVSMAVAQRAEFASVIRSSGGIGGLLERLAAKTSHLTGRRYVANR